MTPLFLEKLNEEKDINPPHEQVKTFLNLCGISMECLGRTFVLRVEKDKISGDRTYLQVEYLAPCSKTKEELLWKGRKWYLSSYMTSDEIVKTAYTAFKTAVEHEIMEGFKIQGIPLFNPHTPFTEILKASQIEKKRHDKTT